jgi:hypothetical protein
MKIKLDRELLLDTLNGDAEETELLSTEEVGASRWANIYAATFKYQDKIYQVEYRRGTGDNGESPFENAYGYDIDCIEVEPYEVSVTKYRPVTPPKEKLK